MSAIHSLHNHSATHPFIHSLSFNSTHMLSHEFSHSLTLSLTHLKFNSRAVTSNIIHSLNHHPSIHLGIIHPSIHSFTSRSVLIMEPQRSCSGRSLSRNKKEIYNTMVERLWIWAAQSCSGQHHNLTAPVSSVQSRAQVTVCVEFCTFSTRQKVSSL